MIPMLKHALSAAAILTLVGAAVSQKPNRTVGKLAQRTLPGIAVPDQHVALSTPLEGVLTIIHVSEGDKVRKGQPLAQMDDRVAKAAVAAAQSVADRRAEIAHATEELKFAEKKLERLQRAGSAVSAAMVEEAEARRNQARASLDSAKEAHEQAWHNLTLEQVRLECLTIRAPFDGRVTRVLASQGATLTTQHELLHLASLTTLRVDLQLPVSSFRALASDRDYWLQAAAPVGQRLRGRLVYIDPVIDPGTRTFRCRFVVENPDERHPAGFSVKLQSLTPIREPLGQTKGKGAKKVRAAKPPK